jgi:hypothetical protein
MSNTLTILHPGVEKPAQAQPQPAPRRKALQGARLALLDNGKVNAGALLKVVAARLQQLGVGEVRAWKKQHAAQPGEVQIPELLDWKPDLVLTGVGD